MNETIKNAIELVKSTLEQYKNEGKIVSCSVSGGADSDILIDLCERAEPHYVKYVFFDTGIEYQATKEHLNWLEEHYQIEILRYRAKVPVPLGNKKYGVPFLSKQVSNYISRLQKHNFDWSDKDFETLYKKYPNCKIGLKWWCNEAGEDSHFNINRNTWLKEYLIAHPPKFYISDKCCEGAKKCASDNYNKESKSDLFIMGARKSEGGARSTAYKDHLFYNVHRKIDYFLPILFFTSQDRKEYENEFNIIHSKCYSEYGLSRTGCAGCPFGKDYNLERNVIKENEPKLSKAIENMWGEVYDYTTKYYEFQRLMNLKYKRKKKCECGCTEFDGDTVAMNLKYRGRDCNDLYCKDCFKQVFKMSEKQYNETIEDFKIQGCELF